MRKQLKKALMYGLLLDLIYMAEDGSISKRRVKVLQVGDDSFKGYCFLRGAKRTFKIDNVLALVPAVRKERSVV